MESSCGQSGSIRETDQRNNDHSERNNTSTRVLLFFSSILFVTVMVTTSLYSHTLYFPHKLDSFSEDSKSTLELKLTATNEYSYKNLSMFPYPFLEDSLFLEIHKEHEITISDAHLRSDCELYWSLWTDGETSVGSGLIDGLSFMLAPASLGKLYLTISEEECVDGAKAKSFTTVVWVKYVRRELQSLTDTDRDAFLHALHTLWTVSTVEGKALYGDNYKSLYYFATIHNDAGGNSVCDEFHSNSGFVNNHVYLGAFLEQSLQLVDPRVALHYIEYTKYFSSEDFNAHLADQMDGGNWTELLSDKYFGQNDPITGEIIDGRWAGVSLPYLDNLFFLREGISENETFFPEEESLWLESTQAHVTSPYGLLRSPWNYNPSTYILRYNNVNRINASRVSKHVFKPYMGSTCSDYKSFIKNYAVGQSLETYLKEAEAQAHGKIHFSFGGAGGNHSYEVDQYLQANFGLSDDDIVLLSSAAQTFFKTYVPTMSHDVTDNFPLSCSAIPWQNESLTTTAWPATNDGPSCACRDTFFTSSDRVDELIDLFFIDYLDDDDMTTMATIKAMNFDAKTEVMQAVCGRMQFDGDMAGSGAATDPLFWVAHGAIERLFQRVIFEGVLSDTDYRIIERANSCSGHAANSSKAWLRGFRFQDATIDASRLTNAELSDMLLPSSDAYRDNFNFVYEDSTWDWCDGFDNWFKSSSARKPGEGSDDDDDDDDDDV